MGIQIYHKATDIENLFLGCKFKPKILVVDLEVLHREAALEANEKHSTPHKFTNLLFFHSPSTIF